MTECVICGSTLENAGFQLDIEFPTDGGEPARVAGPICEGDADWLGVEIVAEAGACE